MRMKQIVSTKRFSNILIVDIFPQTKNAGNKFFIISTQMAGYFFFLLWLTLVLIMRQKNQKN